VSGPVTTPSPVGPSSAVTPLATQAPAGTTPLPTPSPTSTGEETTGGRHSIVEVTTVGAGLSEPQSEPLAKSGVCEGKPVGWMDSWRKNCTDYVVNQWCTPTGGYGAGWNLAEYGTFDNYTANGVNAVQACCECGGGRYDGCNDYPDGFVDNFGYSCLKYTQADWCTVTGEYGSGWVYEKWGGFSHYSVNGMNPKGACCGCGGGTALFYEGCTTVPEGWEDSRGYSCDTYESSHWCTLTGYGSGWNASWGGFRDYAVLGVSAEDACCICGGGSADERHMNQLHALKVALVGIAGAFSLIILVTCYFCFCVKRETDPEYLPINTSR